MDEDLKETHRSSQVGLVFFLLITLLVLALVALDQGSVQVNKHCQLRTDLNELNEDLIASSNGKHLAIVSAYLDYDDPLGSRRIYLPLKFKHINRGWDSNRNNSELITLNADCATLTLECQSPETCNGLIVYLELANSNGQRECVIEPLFLNAPKGKHFRLETPQRLMCRSAEQTCDERIVILQLNKLEFEFGRPAGSPIDKFITPSWPQIKQ